MREVWVSDTGIKDKLLMSKLWLQERIRWLIYRIKPPRNKKMYVSRKTRARVNTRRRK